MAVRKRQLVIIDPDAFYAGIFARRFEAARWAVRVADGVSEATKFIAKKIPDAVLLDVETVPKATDFIRSLEGEPKTAGIVVVALTALGDRTAIKEIQAAGADGYFLKGHFVPSEVREKLERLVAEAAER